MFVPVHDYNPLKSIPFQYVTVALITINVVVFVISMTSMDLSRIGSFAVVPAELTAEGLGAASPDDRFDGIPIPERWTLITYMFLHGDILHLLGNMLFLWVFGDNVEDAMGHLRFLVFYLLCGIIAAFVHIYVTNNPEVPLIGASGAVSGVVAAYLMLHPRVTMWVLFARVIPLKISAAWALGAWIVMQFVYALLPTPTAVAFWAHVGGVVAGAVLILIMRRPGVKLFDQTPSQI